jgi:hypothetical protein
MATKLKLYFFRRKGIIFIPIHFVGWLFLFGVLAAAGYVFADLYFRTYNIGETLTDFSIFLIILLLGYTFFAFNTCRPEKETFE